MMKPNFIKPSALAAAAVMLAACADDGAPVDDELRLYGGAAAQTFSLNVESMGEAQRVRTAAVRAAADSAAAADSVSYGAESFINSITPTQRIDRVTVVVARRSDGRVVLKRALTGWSDTNNRTSRPYADSTATGRTATLTLTGDERLRVGEEYIAYAVGNHTGTYGGYQPFSAVSVGGTLTAPEVVSKPDGELAAELFAGAQSLTVDAAGRIVSLSHDAAEAAAPTATLTLRRQVGGTFGYFTRIPATVNGIPVAALRMASPKAYGSIVMAGFRSQEDSTRFDAERVVNGATERTAHDAVLHDGTPAFMIYRIDLRNWFPGNTADAALPLDASADGYLDAADANWQLSDYLTGSGLNVARGAVYGSRYLIATAMTPDDVAAALPTFELQLLDRNDSILRHWSVELRDSARLTAPRTLVSLGADGRTVSVSTLTTPESATTFSLLRNNLYTLGQKNSNQSYGEDTPIRLADAPAGALVVDVNPEWQAQGAIIFH